MTRRIVSDSPLYFQIPKTFDGESGTIDTGVESFWQGSVEILIPEEALWP
jgi:hypothetical protein